jgi:hypothetical protein
LPNLNLSANPTQIFGKSHFATLGKSFFLGKFRLSAEWISPRFFPYGKTLKRLKNDVFFKK